MEEEHRQAIEAMEAKLANAQARIESLRAEAARHRVARNDALRVGAALTSVVKAHNIAFNVGDHDLSSLAVENGEIVGTFEYEAPDPNGKPEPKTPPGGAPEALTREAVAKMSSDEIMKRWDDVQAAMAG